MIDQGRRKMSHKPNAVFTSPQDAAALLREAEDHRS